ncbi:hypothetical protein [Roseateles chitosanitabidus]|uniref:hypothetical protein n=1 Tax=Roseateles chitosanitabidus TaxID=65048 RepID=UPI0011DF603B|nr:hypothetical protein [Roseateles chitosanitabidus]
MGIAPSWGAIVEASWEGRGMVVNASSERRFFANSPEVFGSSQGVCGTLHHRRNKLQSAEETKGLEAARTHVGIVDARHIGA